MKSTRVLAGLLLLFAIYTSCENNDNSESKLNSNLKLGDTLMLNYKDTVFNYEHNIWLCFDSILADSRCPDGARCELPSGIKVGLLFGQGDSITEFGLGLSGLFEPQDTIIYNYSIEFLSIYGFPDPPARVEDNTIEVLVK